MAGSNATFTPKGPATAVESTVIGRAGKSMEKRTSGAISSRASFSLEQPAASKAAKGSIRATFRIFSNVFIRWGFNDRPLLRSYPASGLAASLRASVVKQGGKGKS